MKTVEGTEDLRDLRDFNVIGNRRNTFSRSHMSIYKKSGGQSTGIPQALLATGIPLEPPHDFCSSPKSTGIPLRDVWQCRPLEAIATRAVQTEVGTGRNRWWKQTQRWKNRIDYTSGFFQEVQEVERMLNQRLRRQLLVEHAEDVTIRRSSNSWDVQWMCWRLQLDSSSGGERVTHSAMNVSIGLRTPAVAKPDECQR